VPLVLDTAIGLYLGFRQRRQSPADRR
jgi:hypothetical protein